MTREREIEILMMDGDTKAEAEQHLKNGSVIFDDFEEHFEMYMKEWKEDEEDILMYRKMIDKKIPAPDWGVVEDNGKAYYIMYCL